MYSQLFQIVPPTATNASEGRTPDYPSQVQDILESAISRRRTAVQAEILEFTKKKKEEFRIWREQAQSEAKLIATMATLTPDDASEATNTEAAISITRQNPKTVSSNSDLFQKSPISQHAHPNASPLAAASLPQTIVERPATPSPPPKG